MSGCLEIPTLSPIKFVYTFIFSNWQLNLFFLVEKASTLVLALSTLLLSSSADLSKTKRRGQLRSTIFDPTGGVCLNHWVRTLQLRQIEFCFQVDNSFHILDTDAVCFFNFVFYENVLRNSLWKSLMQYCVGVKTRSVPLNSVGAVGFTFYLKCGRRPFKSYF